MDFIRFQKNRKRWFSGGYYLLLLTVLLGIAECLTPLPLRAGSFSNSPTVLRIGSQLTYPPIEFRDANSTKVRGVSAELLSEVARRLGMSIEWVQSDYSALITGLMAGRFDIASGGISDQPERRKIIDFINYMKVGTGILVRNEDRKELTRLEDFSGRKVSLSLGATRIQTLINETSETLRKEGKEPITIVALPNTSEAIMQLNLHRVDGYLNETPMLAYLIQQVPGKYAILGDGRYILTPLLTSWGFRKENDHLRDRVKATLDGMFRDGTYLKILHKWNLSEGSLLALAINGTLENVSH